ncbi:glucose dehydrogenase [FAD, quinone]-like isoform X1 [Dermacentor variabilis]|uniref:glucose dehydrogenase [FAD, quinone]-like isoform X1 n=1 Tax=Dermacentor variabilis TaxID=34621 RepID=UPI003F5BB60A
MMLPVCRQLCVLAAALAAAALMTPCHCWPTFGRKRTRLLDSYDYVIVGGGSAGSVLANRLSADPGNNVLLLEAGGPETVAEQVPFLAPFLATEANTWGYKTVPQKDACLGFPERRAGMTQGKILGGSSVLNSMSFVRGNRKDYDTWQDGYGAHGWSYEDVLPVFKEIETYYIRNPGQYHGTSGEIPVNYANTHTPLSDAFLKACNESGYLYVDYNGRRQSGYSRVEANVAHGTRQSANRCFLSPVRRKRPNLHISLYSLATKVTFEGKRASGVKFTKNCKVGFVAATREVIVSAGAINSAKLLLLSGVGPRQDLETLKIPVVADLPVGRGLQDHVVFTGLVVTTPKDEVGVFNISAIQQYAYNRTGVLAIPGGTEVILFTSSQHRRGADDFPDIQTVLTDLFPGDMPPRPPQVSQEVYERYYRPMEGKKGFMATLVMIQPKSRGTVTLNATNPSDQPLIDPRFLSQAEDVKRTVKGIMKIRKLLQADGLRNIGAKLWDVPYPPCLRAGSVWSAAYLDCFLRQTGFPAMHVCCTCAMGNHSLAVVDERLRVKGGVTGLRVADASVMPAVTTGNTNAPVLMIGAKAAAIILKDNA